MGLPHCHGAARSFSSTRGHPRRLWVDKLDYIPAALLSSGLPVACCFDHDVACLVRAHFPISSKPLNVTLTTLPDSVMLQASTLQDNNCSMAMFYCAFWPRQLCRVS